jgi:hypothetical protein
MACTSSVLPFLWLAARGIAPTSEDFLYAAVLWKFYGLFLLIRASVRTERHVARCLYIVIGASAIVAVVAILQALNIAGVPQLVDVLYPPDGAPGPAGSSGRGSSTLGSPISVGDVMAYSLAVSLGMLMRTREHRRALTAAALLFGVGGLASGQLSGALAVGLAIFGIAVVTGRLRQLLTATVPLVALAALPLWPILRARMQDVDPFTSLPLSWETRLYNLHQFIWPQLASGFNWALGVRPAGRIWVDVPWGPYIYIESGHSWLLWTGGIPFLLAFLYFMWVAARAAARIARTRWDSVGAAAIAAFASLLVVFVLMSFDPHITMRGGADLMFALIALATAVPAAAAYSATARTP